MDSLGKGGQTVHDEMAHTMHGSEEASGEVQSTRQDQSGMGSDRGQEVVSSNGAPGGHASSKVLSSNAAPGGHASSDVLNSNAAAGGSLCSLSGGRQEAAFSERGLGEAGSSELVEAELEQSQVTAVSKELQGVQGSLHMIIAACIVQNIACLAGTLW
jgi:hypothetical protein